MIELEPSHSHLYPGARGRVLSCPADGPAILRFADGGEARGRLEGGVLRLDAHTTAAGTRIPAKAWLIEIAGEGFRVLARAGA